MPRPIFWSGVLDWTREEEEDDEDLAVQRGGTGSSLLKSGSQGGFNVWLRFLKRRRGVTWVPGPTPMIIISINALHSSL
jgi:hypothetical protein